MWFGVPVSLRIFQFVVSHTVGTEAAKRTAAWTAAGLMTKQRIVTHSEGLTLTEPEKYTAGLLLKNHSGCQRETERKNGNKPIKRWQHKD